MRDAHDGIRRRDLDSGAEGLDCFATEGVEVVAEADDSALAEFDEVLPAGSERGWVELPAPRPSWPGSHKAAVALIVVLVGVAGFWMTMRRERPVTTAAVAPVRRAAPAAPSVVPSSERAPSERARPVPVPPAAAAVTVPRDIPTVASPRASAAAAAPPRRASVAPATVSPNPAIAPEVAPPAPLAATPAVSVQAPVVVATPELVKAEPAAAAAPSPAAIVAPPSDRASIERVLQQYRDAYDRLDAPSAAVIWPRVDTRALSRAFSTLASQDLSFDHCDLDIAGGKASAQCTGAIRYVRRVGDQAPRMRRMSWSFAFERVSDRWQIAQVTAD
jgi:hypothetical protein